MKNFIINSTLVGFILSAVALTTPASAQNYPEFKGSFVIDQADIIPAEEEAVLNKKLIDYKTKTLNEVAVVTVTSLEGQDIKTYANTYFRKLGVGNKDANNGVMLLVAPNDRKVRIEIGYGLESWFTDMKSSNIISDVILPEFKAGNMADGVLKGADAVMVAATPPTAEELAAAKKIAQAQALRAKQTWDSVVEFMLTVLFICAMAAAAFLVYWIMTGPRRRAEARAQAEADRIRAELIAERQREEQLRYQAAEKERQRHAALERKRQQEREAHALKVRTDMLAAMSVTERNAFLEREREAKRIADEAAAAIRAQHAEEQRVERERQRQREREREEERAEERRRSSSSSSSYSSSSSSYGGSSSSSSSSDFGGGSSGGGGSDSSW